MGRHSQSRALSVWMNGELVGHWRLPAAGTQEFAYAESWLASPAARPLSLSMPLRPSGRPYRGEAAAYFAFDVLEVGGTFVAKVLAGGAENQLQALLKRNFRKVANVNRRPSVGAASVPAPRAASSSRMRF